MFKLMFEIGLMLIGSIIDLFWGVFTYPLYLIFDTVVPDLTSIVTNITTFINGTLLDNFVYFFSIFPPTTKLVISFWFSLLLAFFTIYVAYCTIYLVYHLVCKLTDLIT